MAPAKIVITQVRSAISTTRSQRETLRSLGLRGIRKQSVRTADPVTMGMVRKVSQLISVEEAGSLQKETES